MWNKRHWKSGTRWFSTNLRWFTMPFKSSTPSTSPYRTSKCLRSHGRPWWTPTTVLIAIYCQNEMARRLEVRRLQGRVFRCVRLLAVLIASLLSWLKWWFFGTRRSRSGPETEFVSPMLYLVGGLEHEFYDFPFSWEFHHPNWRTHIFQRGGSTTNQLLTDHPGDTWLITRGGDKPHRLLRG